MFVCFRVVKSVNFVNILSEQMNNSLLIIHVLRINVLNTRWPKKTKFHNFLLKSDNNSEQEVRI